MGEHKLIMGKDIYFWNFVVLMIFTFFEVGAVSLKIGSHLQPYGEFSSSLVLSKDSELEPTSCTFGMILEFTFELHSSQHSSSC